jgi:hypothetical protein
VAIVRILALPRGFWTAREVRLAEALLTFDGAEPPLFVALARLANVFVRDPFVSMVGLSVIASIAAALFIAISCARLLGTWSGAAVALVALLSPGLLMFGSLPDGESVAIALVAATFFFFVDRRPELFAIAAAAAIGARLQILPAMLIVFLIGLAVMPRKGRSLAVFASTALILFVPVGRVDLFDAGAAFNPDLVARFIAHPWGGKLLSMPLLVSAGAGLLISLKRRRDPAVAAMAAFASIHIATCILTASPLEGVQPMLPAMLPVAFFAVATFGRWPALSAVVAVLYVAGAFAYTWPSLVHQARSESPPVAAMHHVARNAPGAVIVAAPDLAPFAFLAGDLRVVTPERLGEFTGRSDVDVQLLAHGRSPAGDAIVFEQPASDACRKLRSGRYHMVSLVPQPVIRRYLARSGVFHMESSPDRAEWRWLGKEAVIEPPQEDAVVLRLRLPDDSPLASNRLNIGNRTVEILRGATVEITVPSSPQIVIRSERSFTAADGRDLAVQLISLENASGAGARSAIALPKL